MGCKDAGQVLMFALFLLFFVVLLVVGESLVLLARFREDRSLTAEADSRQVVDWSVGHVNDIAASFYHLGHELTGTTNFSAVLPVKAGTTNELVVSDEYRKWRTRDNKDCVEDVTAKSAVKATSCWRIIKALKGTDTSGLGAKVDREVIRITVEAVAGCTIGLDQLPAPDDEREGASGCATGEVFELAFRRRSLFDYVLHYDEARAALRWGAADPADSTKGRRVVFYVREDQDTARDIEDDFDRIDGPIHTNESTIYVCGTANPSEFKGPFETNGGGSFTDAAGCGTNAISATPTDTGSLQVKGIVTDPSEDATKTTPECDVADPTKHNVEWLRDARRAAEAGAAGWHRIPAANTDDYDGTNRSDVAEISLTDLNSGGTYAAYDNIYVEGDLILTEGLLNDGLSDGDAAARSVSLIATGDIFIMHEGEKHELPTSSTTPEVKEGAKFGADDVKDENDRPYILGLIAGCDIIIDYEMKKISSLSWGSDLRPKEPPDPKQLELEHKDRNLSTIYPTSNWTKVTHQHEWQYDNKQWLHSSWSGPHNQSCSNTPPTLTTPLRSDPSTSCWTSNGAWEYDWQDRVTTHEAHFFWGGVTNYNPSTPPEPIFPYGNRTSTGGNVLSHPWDWKPDLVTHYEHGNVAYFENYTYAAWPFSAVSYPYGTTHGFAKTRVETSPTNAPTHDVGVHSTTFDDPLEHHDDTSTPSKNDDADDEYCVKWGEWEMEDRRKKWKDIVKKGSHTNALEYIEDSTVPSKWRTAAGYNKVGQRDQGPPTEDTPTSSNHARSQTGGLVNRTTLSDSRNQWHGEINYKGNHHGDYTDSHDPAVRPREIQGNGNKNSQRSRDTTFDPPTGGSTPYIPDVRNYAIWDWNNSDGTKLNRMKDPEPFYELCDFMNFTLQNVAILAPSGGILAKDWEVPRQRRLYPLPIALEHRNNPTITIKGSISVKHRGLFGQYGDVDYDVDYTGTKPKIKELTNAADKRRLITGYRKSFEHPAGFEEAVPAWWPEIKQDFWAPLPRAVS